jgi:saccharopine dehydrogenase (NAD+, L-lysine-forming)
LEARGQKDGHPEALNLLLSHPDGYVFTAVPVVACLLQCLDGSAVKPGLWTQAWIVEPERLLQDMQRMGIQLEIS